MLDNQTRRELLSKARQSGFPGSILDVFTAYEQGKDLIGEFQQQQQQQQSQQMSDMAAQQAGMMPPGQQPLPQEMPQAPAGPPPGLQGQSLPSPEPPANPNLVDSTQQQPVGMATNAKGSSGGQVIMANGGFVEKFTEDQYNKFSTHFPFSKEQRGSIAHNATVENPDLTMVRPKKYVFGGLKYAVGGFEGDPLKRANVATAQDSALIAGQANQVLNFYKKEGYGISPKEPLSLGSNWANDLKPNNPNENRIFLNTRVIKDGQLTPSRISTKDYYKDLGNHKFKQRELQTGTINIDAPMQLYDDRIKPQYGVTFGKDLSSPTRTLADAATVWGYDKLAVTPWSQLTETQKIKRLQQYGGSGTPYKDKASITNAIKELKNPVPARLDMKEATGFPIPQVDIKPQITSLPIPQTTKQRVTINTGQGDKVRVQDIKTKRFLGWEDPSGETLDFEEYKPTGNATEDFPEMRRIKTPSFAKGGFATDPPAYTLPTLEVKATRNNPVPKMLEPGFNDELAYSEAKNKLMLRQQLEAAQARFMGGENILDAIKDQDLAGQAFQTMLEKYPNDKRLTSKETTRGKAAGSFLIQKAIERYLGKKLPLISNNQNYQYAIEGIKRGNNMVSPIFEIRQFQDAERDAQNQYSNYTEELQNKVDTYEKAHGTYQPGLFERMRKTNFKFEAGGKKIIKKRR
jgi:hypothetical protein